MQTQYGAVLLSHEFVASLASGFNHGYGGRRECGEDGGGSVLHVGVDSHAECLFASFHEVASAAAVNVHFDATGHHAATLCIDDFSSNNGQAAIFYGFNLVVFNDDRTSFNPSLRGEDAAVDDLLQHISDGL